MRVVVEKCRPTHGIRSTLTDIVQIVNRRMNGGAVMSVPFTHTHIYQNVKPGGDAFNSVCVCRLRTDNCHNTEHPFLVGF